MCCPVCRRASVDTEGAVTLSITPDTFIGTRRDVFNLQSTIRMIETSQVFQHNIF